MGIKGKMRQDLYKELFEVENHHWWHQHKREVIFKLAKRFANKGKVLDIGAGTGKILAEFKKIGWQVEGVDGEKEALVWSKKRGIKLKFMDFEKEALPFKNNSFDLILALDVLEHLKDDKKVLAEIKRVAKKRSMIIISVPAYEKLFDYWDKIVGHQRRYSRQMLRQLIKSQNLQIEYLSYWFMYIFLPAVIIRKLKSLTPRKRGISDFQEAVLPWLTIPILKVLSKIEQIMLSLVPLPFGLSLICIVRKNE